MFVAQAHSFTQQARLAITLAWVAGCTNIVAILACGHVVSHVSGTTSDFGRDVVLGEWAGAAFLGFLLMTFLLGAFLSGFATEFGRRRGWESIYVLPMALEAVLLAAFAFGVEVRAEGLASGTPLYLMTGAASVAMGLQNATITRISSGVVRTTHVTGVLTDLGLEMAQMLLWLRDKARDIDVKNATAIARSLHHHPTARRLALLLSILLSFALGAGLGALLYRHQPRIAMFPPVIFLAWIIYQDVIRPIAEIEPSELIGNANLGLPDALVVYHLRKDRRRAARRGGRQRLPNLIAWSERLPEKARVVVLDLDEVTALDDNSATELRSALARFRQQGRRMVIAGVTGAQIDQLRAAADDLLDPDSVCPDLELAIARGLVLLEQFALQQRRAQRAS
ncbi:MAG: DUF1275 family protein [Planctomycetota bacterium]|nr:DUF1275 family protein [Planctomycetota bacterium]